MDTLVTYLAGFFDGEGSIGLNEIRSKVRIRVGQVVEEPLQRYANMFGGSVRFSQITSGYLPYFQYDTNHTVRCGKILTDLYPYLIVKQATAQVALERLGLPVPTLSTDIDIGYLAGFFDAEGSVSIRRIYPNKIQAIIRVRQNDELPLLVFKQMFDGYVTETRQKTQAGNRAFEWKLKLSDVTRFCDLMLPHVLVKREHLTIVRQLVSIRLSNNGKDSRKEEKHALADKVDDLNNMQHLRVV